MASPRFRRNFRFRGSERMRIVAFSSIHCAVLGRATPRGEFARRDVVFCAAAKFLWPGRARIGWLRVSEGDWLRVSASGWPCVSEIDWLRVSESVRLCTTNRKARGKRAYTSRGNHWWGSWEWQPKEKSAQIFKINAGSAATVPT
jgi:hypothetical protein